MSESKTTESNLPQSKVNYTFDETTREITRSDLNGAEVLARLEGKSIVWKDAKLRKFHAPVIRFLNDEGLKFEDWRVEGAATDAAIDPASIPPAPKKDPRFGDKTPEFVEWLKKYKPNDYNNRYGIIGPGSVKRSEATVDSRGRPAVRRWTENGVTLARRKNHLTELKDGNDQEDGE